jgi:hypothetical protein
MKIIQTIIIALYLFSGLIVNGQDNPVQNFVLLQGIVMDGETELPIANVHYIINNFQGGATGSDGKFSLYMNRTDTVIFSYIGYIDIIFTLSDTLIGNKLLAGIFMQTDTFSVGEVIVIPRMADLRTEFRSGSNQISQDMVNAQNNVSRSAFQGINSQASLGDPETNYQLLKQKQTIDAYEKGGIPSDMMIGINFISIIPATIYLLANGLPERPDPPKPNLSQKEMEKIKAIYKRNLEKGKK